MTKLLRAICLMMVVILMTGCDYNYNDVSSENFATEIIEITNTLEEKYRVEYVERNGFPDQQMNVKIYNVDQCIADYTTECENKYVPNKILYLFSSDNCEYYFLSNENADYVFWYNKSTVVTKNNIIIINAENSKMKKSDKYVELSKEMQQHIDKETLSNKFEICEYDSTDIMSLYELAD